MASPRSCEDGEKGLGDFARQAPFTAAGDVAGYAGPSDGVGPFEGGDVGAAPAELG